MKSTGITYGYIRVSTLAQRDDRQWLAMEGFGVAKELVFVDKQSGKDFNRPAYTDLVGRLQVGDTVVVKSIDRLGRSYQDIIEQWRIITKEKKAAVVVLDMPLLDTRQKCGDDLTGTLISDIVLELFSYVAQTEREMNHQRTMEGIVAAKARGVKFGRRPMERPAAYESVKAQWEAKEVSAREAARQLGISHYSFLKWVRK